LLPANTEAAPPARSRPILPAGVKADEVSASYSNGILEIHVPIERSSTPHRVPVSFTDKK